MSLKQTRTVNFAKDFDHKIGHLYARLHVCMIWPVNLDLLYLHSIFLYNIPSGWFVTFFIFFLTLIMTSVPFLLGSCGGAPGPPSAVLDHWINLYLMISHCHTCLILSCSLFGFICPAQQLSVDVQAFDAVSY